MRSRTKIKQVLNQICSTADDGRGVVGPSFFSVQKSQWLILHSFHPSSCPVIHGLRRGPHLPGEINSDFNCVDVSNSLLPTRTNFHPLRCQMALNISANHGSTRGELKEMGSEWRVRRALRCGDGVEDPSYPLVYLLQPCTHTHTLNGHICVESKDTVCGAYCCIYFN